MRHIDLFSGIGGFALAADRVWPSIEHTFVEYDMFCQAILRKHYPNSTIHGDIRTFIADTERERRAGKLRDTEGQHRLRNRSRTDEKPFILTGGFPCQPFSHAGRRKGTGDDRYLWPQMFRVIQLYRPTWVIAENVRGLVTWNEGLVLETVCTDLESEGYEVQPIVIPACAVGAPHRRDRVWIVAQNTNNNGGREGEHEKSFNKRFKRYTFTGNDVGVHLQQATANPRQQLWSERRGEKLETDTPEWSTGSISDKRGGFHDWQKNWREVALATCHDGVDDGLPRQMDGVTISAARHRKERLKACGNAIVPQVAEHIMQAMKAAP